MKSNILQKNFPDSPEAWEKLIAAAPIQVSDPDCPYDPNNAQAVEAYWKDAVIVRKGGLPAVQAALAEKRRLRGAQKAPTKVSTTIRFDADVLAAVKASGRGWQTRVNEAVREWLKSHSAI
jgi:uncharacterized protein (DUF4415 family)